MTFLTIAQKDLRVLMRDRTALIFIFALPLAFTFILGFVFARSSDKPNAEALKVLVANQDAGKEGAALVESLGKVGLNVVPAGSSDVTQQVKKGEQAVGVVIPGDFSANLRAAITKMAAGESAAPVHLTVIVDPAQAQIGGMAQGAIFAATQRTTAPLFRAAALERVPQEYRKFAEQQMGNSSGRSVVALDVSSQQSAQEKLDKPSAGDNVMPGFVVYFVFFTANSVAATLLLERQEGTLRRMLSAPIAPGTILFGKLLARALLALLQTVLLFGIGFVFFHVHVGSSLFGLALTALATIFASTGLGLLIASMGRTQEQIQGMTTFVLVIMGLLSGCFVPRAFMPEAMQKLSLITPHAWALSAYQDLLLRKLPLASALPNIGVVLLFGAAFYGLALKRFQFE